MRAVSACPIQCVSSQYRRTAHWSSRRTPLVSCLPRSRFWSSSADMRVSSKSHGYGGLNAWPEGCYRPLPGTERCSTVLPPSSRCRHPTTPDSAPVSAAFRSRWGTVAELVEPANGLVSHRETEPAAVAAERTWASRNRGFGAKQYSRSGTNPYPPCTPPRQDRA